MLPMLDAPRLRLRTLTEADVPAIFSIFSNAEALRYWSHGPMSDPAEADRLLDDIRRHAAAGTLFQWGIARRETGEVIGTCTLHRIERAHRRAELGYIVKRELWGNGFAHEALTALLDHAFGTMGLHKLEADIDPRNAASIRSVEKLGFKREGHLRERYQILGEIQDSLIYGLLAPEWHAR
jgi:RimJ/RimL family protein N-acetyltransferase